MNSNCNDVTSRSRKDIKVEKKRKKGMRKNRVHIHFIGLFFFIHANLAFIDILKHTCI